MLELCPLGQHIDEAMMLVSLSNLQYMPLSHGKAVYGVRLGAVWGSRLNCALYMTLKGIQRDTIVGMSGVELLV